MMQDTKNKVDARLIPFFPPRFSMMASARVVSLLDANIRLSLPCVTSAMVRWVYTNRSSQGVKKGQTDYIAVQPRLPSTRGKNAQIHNSAAHDLTPQPAHFSDRDKTQRIGKVGTPSAFFPTPHHTPRKATRGSWCWNHRLDIERFCCHTP